MHYTAVTKQSFLPSNSSYHLGRDAAEIPWAVQAILGHTPRIFSKQKGAIQTKSISERFPSPFLDFKIKHPSLSTPTTEQSGSSSCLEDPRNLKPQGLLKSFS